MGNNILRNNQIIFYTYNISGNLGSFENQQKTEKSTHLTHEVYVIRLTRVGKFSMVDRRC